MYGLFRYDYFLIWGNGLSARDGILSRIRSHPALEILKVVHHLPESVDRLVEVVYSYDYAPIQHLKGKTEYLRQTAPETYFIFVRNFAPREDYFGTGTFRHIESATIKELKEEIRNLYNRRVDGVRTEEHVIHASDNTGQTDYILRYLGFSGTDMFECSHLGLDAPYHLGRKLECFSIIRIALADLCCRIVVGDENLHLPRRTCLEATPHYRALCGDGEDYRDYVRRFLGMALTDDHHLEKFLALRESFRYLDPPNETAYIMVRKTSDGKYLILDGVHRAVILKFRGVTHAHVAIL